MHKQKFLFRLMCIDDIPRGTTGIYAIWYKVTDICIYVGKAQDQDIGSRLHQHWSKPDNKTLRMWMQNFGAQLEFCYLSVNRESDIGRLETRLINLFNPEANIIGKRR